jgi:hypothetical protein
VVLARGQSFLVIGASPLSFCRGIFLLEIDMRKKERDGGGPWKKERREKEDDQM